jgi:hypothetical protein
MNVRGNQVVGLSGPCSSEVRLVTTLGDLFGGGGTTFCRLRAQTETD